MIHSIYIKIECRIKAKCRKITGRVQNKSKNAEKLQGGTEKSEHSEQVTEMQNRRM